MSVKTLSIPVKLLPGPRAFKVSAVLTTLTIIIFFLSRLMFRVPCACPSYCQDQNLCQDVAEDVDDVCMEDEDDSERVEPENRPPIKGVTLIKNTSQKEREISKEETVEEAMEEIDEEVA